MQSCKMYINGKWVAAESGKTYKVVNPTTEEPIGEVPLGGKEDVDKAVAAAKAAFPAWAAKPLDERIAAVRLLSQKVKEAKEELVKLEIAEHGTMAVGAPFMVGFASSLLDFAADGVRTMMGDVVTSAPNTLSYLKREPVGVCGIITPWNVPLAMVASKLGPALVTGNTCVIKPPSVNSIEVLKLGELAEAAGIPAGVINIVTGPGGVCGEAIASHPDVDLIAFTGSCETGKDILAAASKTVKRCMLELGGKNPVIIMPDANLDNVLEALLHYVYVNSGQNCASPGRLYVHDSIYDEFVDKFVAASAKMKTGDPAAKDTDMGPLVSAEHRDRVEAYIQSGIDEGATLKLGGKRPTEAPLDKGFYVMPTVFSDVTQDMKIAREEIFGPVATILRYSTEEEAVEKANDSSYGLCASVWTKDTQKGLRIANQLRVGTVWVNQHMNLNPYFPWGGYKESGLGKESGARGLEEYTELKLVCVELDK